MKLLFDELNWDISEETITSALNVLDKTNGDTLSFAEFIKIKERLCSQKKLLKCFSSDSIVGTSSREKTKTFTKMNKPDLNLNDKYLSKYDTTKE